MQHTPGQWLVSDNGETITVRDQSNGRIAGMHWLKGEHGLNGRRSDSEVEANACLIASAPDLLAALKEFVATFCGWQGPLIDIAKAAIAKATGEKP
jgi:hypothetical protein